MSMDKVSFQNGFITGMATKGLVRSGELYKPLCWNDEGVYSCFYIDFRRSMEAFSLGMFDQSIIVHDSTQLSVTNIEFISSGIYKIYCDIAGKTHGITVLNKKTSLLAFSSGEQLPVFSTHFYVAGLDSYENLKYIYETADFVPYELTSALETISDFVLWTAIDAGSISEAANYAAFEPSSITETPTIALT